MILEGKKKMNYNKIVCISKNEKSHIWLVQVESFDAPLVLKEKKYGEKEVYQSIAKLKNKHLPQIYEIEEKDGITFINPGALGGFWGKSYCYAVVHKNKITAKIVDVR